MKTLVTFSLFFAAIVSAIAAPQFAAYSQPGTLPPPVVVGPHTHGASSPVHVASQGYVRTTAGFIPILSQSFNLNPDGSYQFSYESGDGSSRHEEGSAVPSSQPGVESSAPHSVQGDFSYESPEGRMTVQYLADENGYQPSGSNIHPEIIKSVAAQVAQARSEGPYQSVPYKAAAASYQQASYQTAPVYVGDQAHIHPGVITPAVYHPPVIHTGSSVHYGPYPTAYPTQSAVTFKA